jgi:hypothetical protein
MGNRNNNILAFAKKIAKYSTNAKQSNDLISNVENILIRELDPEEQFKLRINIEIFISLSTIYLISCWSKDKVKQSKKNEFLSQYGESTKEIFQIFGGCSSERFENYVNLKNVAGKLYHQSLEGKKILKQKNLDRLWDNFAHSTMMSLNFGPQINTKNEQQHILLLRVIKLKLASLHMEVFKILDENKELFL